MTAPTTTDLRPGDDYNDRTTWDELLIPAGWTFLGERRGTTYWRRPGKVDGISATTGYGDGDYDCLYVFSTSTTFEAETAYSKFGAYAHLHHGGDYTAAARQLAADGYGSGTPGALTPFQPEHGANVGLDNPEPHGRRVRLQSIAGLRLRPVRWLWEGRLALGSFALLGGREGLGKSTVAYWLIARITRGDLPGESSGTPRAVIVAATEDSWEHTIGPRLVAAGADLELIYRVDVVTSEQTTATLSLPLDNQRLAIEVEQVGAALILLDPLMSRLSENLDSHKDADVRRALEPLADLADRTGAVVLGLIHVNKGIGGDVLTSVMGSRAFVAVARSVLAVVVDPEDETRRLLGMPKNNLGRTDLPSLIFRIIGVEVPTDEGPAITGVVSWEGESDISVDAAMRDGASDPEVRTATTEAGDWLSDYLYTQGGNADSADIRRAGLAAGHSSDALKRARRRLGIAVTSIGFPRRTQWTAPVGASSGETALTALTALTGDQTAQSVQLVQLEQSGGTGAFVAPTVVAS